MRICVPLDVEFTAFWSVRHAVRRVRPSLLSLHGLVPEGPQPSLATYKVPVGVRLAKAMSAFAEAPALVMVVAADATRGRRMNARTLLGMDSQAKCKAHSFGFGLLGRGVRPPL
jgi:hypothetical protein